MKKYVGVRAVNGQCFCTVVGHVMTTFLPPRNDLWNHSPTGFEWGYAGSGPAQLALALLADATGWDEIAVQWHQDFKSEIVANLPREGWEMDWMKIARWVIDQVAKQLDVTIHYHLAEKVKEVADVDF